MIDVGYFRFKDRSFRVVELIMRTLSLAVPFADLVMASYLDVMPIKA